MTDNPLIECPFCNSSASIIIELPTYQFSKYIARCNNVGCFVHTPEYCDYDSCVKAWNRRTDNTNEVVEKCLLK